MGAAKAISSKEVGFIVDKVIRGKGSRLDEVCFSDPEPFSHRNRVERGAEIATSAIFSAGRNGSPAGE